MSLKTERVHELVTQLNQYRNEYYNKNSPRVPDAVYDRLYDELQAMETETGIILGSSPTHTFENNYNTQEEPIMSENRNHPFTGCTIVATGKLENFTRDGITVLTEQQFLEMLSA